MRLLPAELLLAATIPVRMMSVFQERFNNSQEGNDHTEQPAAVTTKRAQAQNVVHGPCPASDAVMFNEKWRQHPRPAAGSELHVHVDFG